MATCGIPSIAEVTRKFYENADYSLSGSADAARAFASVCRILISHPQRSQFGGVDGESSTYDTQSLLQMAKHAEEWANNRSRVGKQVSYAAFTCLRR